MNRTFVTIGAGQAAAVAARTLRRQGFDGRIVLVGAEPHPPYQRPPLSKGFLTGEEELADLPVLDPAWWEASGVELRLGVQALRLDPAARSVELTGGATLTADAVLLATGVRPRTLGPAASGRVVYLRTIEDAQRLRAALVPGCRLAVAGGGFIGAEVAASARTAGAEVTLVEMAEVPLQRALGTELGRLCAEVHADHGVRVLTGEQVAGVTDTGDHAVVVTRSGLELAADIVVAGLGVIPNTEVAEAAGVAVDDGVLTDEFGRTSVEGVYAAGDVARHHHPLLGRRVRVEHFDNASRMAAAAARAMLGRKEPYADVHWFWSDQYEHNLQYAGQAAPGCEVVVRGSLAERCFSAFYLEGGVVVAAFTLDRGEDMGWARELIAARAAPDPAVLADEDADLADLVLV